MIENLKDPFLLRFDCLINGQWTRASDGQTIDVHNPYNGELLGSVPYLERSQISGAVHAAEAAFHKWKNLMPEERSVMIRKWYDLIISHSEDLARIMVLEQGKPYREALSEIKYAASYLEFYAEEAKRIYGDIIPSPFRNTRIIVLKQPVGVVGIITPWNFPAAMMIRKIAPALATGCTCVVKPDETTPLTALALAELSIRAGIPIGVLNFVTGNPEMIGDVLTDSELIRKISFTGSIKVGKLLMRKSADTVKKITLELGGNAPFIVFEDADIDKAVTGLIDSKFRNAGQTCVCANRVFLHKKISLTFIGKLKERMNRFKVGNGLENSDIGPLINQEAIRKLELLIQDAKEKGASVETGGDRHPLGGNFFEPTILSHVHPDMQIFCTEIFGPIVTIIEFEDTEEVIRLANDTQSGLASYFYTNNPQNIWKVAESLEYGIVGINSGIISSAAVPFGGVKESGFGREGSRYGIDDYVTIKYIHWCMG